MKMLVVTDHLRSLTAIGRFDSIFTCHIFDRCTGTGTGMCVWPRNKKSKNRSDSESGKVEESHKMKKEEMMTTVLYRIRWTWTWTISITFDCAVTVFFFFFFHFGFFFPFLFRLFIFFYCIQLWCIRYPSPSALCTILTYLYRSSRIRFGSVSNNSFEMRSFNIILKSNKNVKEVTSSCVRSSFSKLFWRRKKNRSGTTQSVLKQKY